MKITNFFKKAFESQLKFLVLGFFFKINIFENLGIFAE
jgi:hypothetical protein